MLLTKLSNETNTSQLFTAGLRVSGWKYAAAGREAGALCEVPSALWRIMMNSEADNNSSLRPKVNKRIRLRRAALRVPSEQDEGREGMVTITTKKGRKKVHCVSIARSRIVG